MPADYLEFLADFGFGELDAAFYVEDGPVKYSAIAHEQVNECPGMYVFAGSSSGVLSAFDSGNNWVVVEISAEVNGFKVLSANFSSSYWISLCILKVWSIGVRITKSRKKLQESPGEKGKGDRFI